jgi:O-antigen/teichoic acid export membrane protein
MTIDTPIRQGFRRTFANLGWLLSSRGTSALLSLAYLGLATRALGVQHFGQFSLILSAAQAIAVLVGTQTWQIIVRYGLPHMAVRADDRLVRLVRGTMILDAASAVVGTLIAIPVLWGLSGWFGLGPGCNCRRSCWA